MLVEHAQKLNKIECAISALERFQGAAENAADVMRRIGRIDKAKELEGAKCMAGEWICNLYDGMHTKEELDNLRKVIPLKQEDK